MRVYVLASALTGVAATALIVVQAVLVAAVLADVSNGAGWADVRDRIIALGLVVTLRATVALVQERLGRRATVETVAELRTAVLARLVAPERVRGTADRRHAVGEAPTEHAATAALLTQGLDALDPYLTRYLPQLLLAATLTPAVLLVIVGQDGLSGLIIGLTLPLVPLFMALVGLATQSQARRRLATLQRLGSQLVDLLTGLPTLRAFGRDLAQVRRVREVGEAYRHATLRTLRTAFLSALVLETLTTLSIALVAVEIGLRLVNGGLDLRTGLTVLMLAPEVYLPLRMVGLHFHASADGVAAAGAALDLLEPDGKAPEALGDADRGSRTPEVGRQAVGTATPEIRLSGVAVEQPGRALLAPAGVSASLVPGRVIAVTGPSGCGKSTLLRVVLGLQSVTHGEIRLDGVPLADVDPRDWWRQVTWLPQRPAVVPGTVRQNALLHAGPDVRDTRALDATAPATTALEIAARAAGLDEVLARLPSGWETLIGHGGHGVSAGQRQRIALTRVLIAPRPVLLLDEPTAHLDRDAEQRVLAALRGLADRGHLVVLVAHREDLVTFADEEVRLHAQASASDAPAAGGRS